MMTTKEQITDWFCERNKIKIEELDKYHRYAIATVFKYAQEQVENLTLTDVVMQSEQLSCGRNITTCVFYKDGGKCSNFEYCKDQTT